MNEQLLALLATNSGMPFSAITNNSHLNKDLGLDSLDIVDFVLQMEDAFRVSITDEEYLPLQTVGQISEYLQTKLILKSIT